MSMAGDMLHEINQLLIRDSERSRSSTPCKSNINEGIGFDDKSGRGGRKRQSQTHCRLYTVAQVAMREMMRNCIP